MSEKYHILWTNLAEYDLEEIFDYISYDNVSKAISLCEKIRNSCETLKILPHRCRIVPELLDINLKSYRELIIKPYRIIFKIEENLIYILGVFDGRRDLEEILLNRLTR